MNQQEAIEAAKALYWAKWIAMDLNGNWHAYSMRPKWSGDQYILNRGGDWRRLGKQCHPKTPAVKVHR